MTHVPTKKMILLGLNTVASKYVVPALRQRGIEPLLLFDEPPGGTVAQLIGETVETHMVDMSSDKALIAWIGKLVAKDKQIRYISSSFDEDFEVTLEIAEQFSLVGPHQSFANVSNKAGVARLVPEDCPPSLRVEPGAEPDANLLAKVIGLDGCIVKPCKGSAGRLTRCFPRLDNVDPTLAVFQHLQSTPMPEWGGGWLIQSLVEGLLFSIEGFRQNRHTQFLGASLRSRVGLTEATNTFPADQRLGEQVCNSARAVVNRLIDATGFENGYFHCEFILRDGKPFLIDANMGRVGGGTIIEQLAVANNCNVQDIVGHVLLLPVIPDVRPPNYLKVEDQKECTAAWFGVEQDCTFLKIRHGELEGCMLTEVAREGAYIPAMGWSDESWIGMISGPAQRALSIASQNIQILTTDGPKTPFFRQHFEES